MSSLCLGVLVVVTVTRDVSVRPLCLGASVVARRLIENESDSDPLPHCGFEVGRVRGSDQLTGGVLEIVEIEADEGEFGSIVGGRERVGATEPLAPGAGDGCRLVNMAMQGE